MKSKRKISGLLRAEELEERIAPDCLSSTRELSAELRHPIVRFNDPVGPPTAPCFHKDLDGFHGGIEAHAILDA
jgi:hypothetical protein